MSYLIIINPHAGNKEYNTIIRQLTAMLEENHKHHVIKYTTKAGDAQLFAQQTTEKTVVVLGGDGTVNEAINGIMVNKTLKPRLAIIPIGTSNMLARGLKISKNMGRAINTIAENRRKDLDLGYIRDKQRYFAIGCGIGLDAVAYKNVEPKIKKIFGEIAYPISFIKTIFNYEPKELLVKTDTNREKAYYVLVLNTAKFTHFLELVKKSSYNDGYLEVLLFTKKDIISQFKYLLGIFTKQHVKFDDVKFYKTKKLEISAKEKVMMHADAEIIGSTPVTIEVVEDAIEVVC